MTHGGAEAAKGGDQLNGAQVLGEDDEQEGLWEGEEVRGLATARCID